MLPDGFALSEWQVRMLAAVQGPTGERRILSRELLLLIDGQEKSIPSMPREGRSSAGGL